MASRRGTITVTMNAETAQAYAAWLQMRRGIEGVEQSLKQLSDAGVNVDKNVGGTMKMVAQEAGKIAMQFAGMGSALAVVATATAAARREYDAFIERQRSSAETSANVGRALHRAAAASGRSVSVDELKSWSEKVNQETGQNQESLLNTVYLLSGRGDLDPKKALSVIAELARQDPMMFETNQEDAEGVIAGAFALMRGKFGDEKWDEKTAVASVLRAYAVGRVEKAGDYSRNLIGGQARNAAFGSYKDDSASLLAMAHVIALGAEDRTGRVSINAQTRLLQQLQQATAPFIKDASVEEQFNFLWKDPRGKAIAAQLTGPLYEEAAQAEKAGLSIEAKGFMAAIQLLNPNSREAALWRQQRGELKAEGWGSDKAAAIQAGRRQAYLDTPVGQAAEQERRGKGTKEGLELAGGNVWTSVQKNVRDALEQSGMSSIEQGLLMTKLNMVGALNPEMAAGLAREALLQESGGVGASLGRLTKHSLTFRGDKMLTDIWSLFNEMKQFMTGSAEETNRAMLKAAQDIADAMKSGKPNQRGSSEHPAAGS